MTTEYLQLHLTIDRYVGGLLNEPEKTEFELYMLDHPEITAEVEYASGFLNSFQQLDNEVHKANAEQVSAEKIVTQDIGIQDTDDRKPSQMPKKSFFLGREYALAATVVLAICGVLLPLLYQHSISLNNEIDRLKMPIVLAEELWLESSRSGSGAQFTIAPDSGLILRVDAGPEPWSRHNLQADSEQSIRLQLANLPSGNYRLSVTKNGASEPVIVHKFSLDAQN